MPRQSRQSSGTGIFHVMMRGINHQSIFEEEEDYYQFITTLDRMRKSYDDEGNPSGTNCTYYAYCLMSNHFHLLIRERGESVGETVKRIASSYVYYYNRKYGRDGHLFKERFKSEPVNDMAYFTVLLRYIHQNPVKAGIVKLVKDYEFSSWGEFDGTIDSAFQICDTQTILNRIPFKDLAEWVNEPLADDICCLDNDNETPRLRLSDDQVWQRIIQLTGVSCSSDFQKLERPVRQESLVKLKELGASVRQLQRLTGTFRLSENRVKLVSTMSSVRKVSNTKANRPWKNTTGEITDCLCQEPVSGTCPLTHSATPSPSCPSSSSSASSSSTKSSAHLWIRCNSQRLYETLSLRKRIPFFCIIERNIWKFHFFVVYLPPNRHKRSNNMTASILRTRVGNRWNTLKYLDNDSKIDLITLLTQSLRVSSERKSISASKYYGVWGDDGMTAEEFVDALQAERKFKQDIVEL